MKQITSPLLRPYPFLILSLLLISISGCDTQDKLADLKNYTLTARQKPTGTIEPLPQFDPYEIFTYRAAMLRDPFQLTVKSTAIKTPKNPHLKPDEKRLKQFLEQFPLNDLNMVGTLSNQTSSFALIRGPAGISRVKLGDYLGQNNGRVVLIGADRVELVEIVPDGDGGWSERPQVIPLKEHSS